MSAAAPSEVPAGATAAPGGHAAEQSSEDAKARIRAAIAAEANKEATYNKVIQVGWCMAGG
jgi:dienelactone hydrolase